MLLSYQERKARIINLDANFVLVKGKNHIGKSCVLKSLYQPLGAEIKKLPEKWDKLAIVLLLFFEIDKVPFKSLLIGKDIIVINPDETIRFKEKIGSYDLCTNMCKLWGVNLNALDNTTPNFPIETIYMPFYIDQDTGWGEAWSSFSKTKNICERSIVRSYLTGIVNDDYFKWQKNYACIEKQLKKYKDEIHSYELLSKQAKKQFKPLDISMDLKSLKERIHSYLEYLRQLRETQKKHLRYMQQLYTRKEYIELGIKQLKKNIQEIENDFYYALNLDDNLVCPTCGAMYKNDIKSRHDLVKDSYACKDLLIHSSKELDEINNQIKTAVEKQNDINASMVSAQDMIKASNDNISIEDLIEAKSQEQILKTITEKQLNLSKDISNLNDEKIKFKSLIKEYEGNGRKEEAESLFVNYVVEAKRKMEVQVDPNKIRFGGKIKATGSALPVNIIAHTFSYLKLMKKYSGPILMPVVVDEPKQQGLQQIGLNDSLSYMFESMPENGQLIVSLADDEDISIPKDTLIVDLNATGCIMTNTDFDTVRKEVEDIMEKDFKRNWNSSYP